MTELEAKDECLVDAAISAVVSEEVPPGPPASIAVRLADSWHPPVNRGHRQPARLIPLALAVCVVLTCAVVWQLQGPRGSVVWADVVKEFHKAKSIQVRKVFYSHASRGENPVIVWRKVSCEECTFKLPGFSREVCFGSDGLPWRIITKDAVQGLALELNIGAKSAVLNETGPATEAEIQRGFASNLVMLENWLKYGKVQTELGPREIDGRRVCGLRVALDDREADFWIDTQSRQIVRFLEPTAAEYDPENDPVAKKPVHPDSEADAQEIKGWMWTDIVYDVPLDEAQYVLTPPADYEVKRIKFRRPTEKDLVEWLEVFAHVRGGTFPDNENPPLSEGDEFTKLNDKPADQRTTWEEKYLRESIREDDIPIKGGNRSVVVLFRFKYRDTWHYHGKGVKLGKANSAVCWYRPEGSKLYRVIYGDLSVRDVRQEDLPLAKPANR